MKQCTFQPLDVPQAPLTGINLVEASAGTGKTWAITELYLRLLLEKQLPLEQILVVTYTKAATEELKDRIRSRLIASRDSVLTDQGDEPIHQWLRTKQIDQRQAASLLTRSIRCFDQAAIFTIHGFCQRALTANAFESGEPFELRVLKDETDLLQQIADDFWRCELHDASALRAAYLSRALLSPDQLLQSVRRHVGKPGLRTLYPQSEDDCVRREEAYANLYSQVRDLWRAASSEIRALLQAHPGLSRSRYSARSVSAWLEAFGAFLTPQAANLELPKSALRFASKHIASATKKGCSPPQHPLFNLCDELLAAHAELQACYETMVCQLKVHLLEFLNRQLEQRKASDGLKSYDDLLTGLDRALSGKAAGALVDGLRVRYRAALIDEFQDTDPLQYRILGRLFAESGSPVFFIGDPKQAIYDFRGADLFAYLRASQDAQRRYTLSVNRRSTPALICAVNTLFENTNNPFVHDEIKFLPAAAPEQPPPKLVVGDDRPEPLRIWFMERSKGTRAINRRQAELRCARATAAEIARLLDRAARGDARIGDRPVTGGDIAIIVRSHHQGSLIDRALREFGVACVQQSPDNVFHSWEALELERVLTAIAEPGRESLIRAALVTDMFGVSGEALYTLSTSGQAWEDRVESIYGYRRTWQVHGFIQMFRTLMIEEQIAARLLSYADGNRRLTNLLHLAELLHNRSSGDRSKMEQLLSWFVQRRRAERSDSDEAQLRLESDEDLVTLLTIHKAKGRQFSIVFCPFPWDGKEWIARAKEFVFHDPTCGFEPTLDFGSMQQQAHRELARREELAERVRLFYVALTRAQHRCYIIWGVVRDTAYSAPAWLFHELARASRNDGSRTARDLESATDHELRADLDRLAARSGGVIAIDSLPVAGDRRTARSQARKCDRLQARSWQRKILPSWRTLSFSALTTGHAREQRSVAESAVPMERTESETLTHFPRGRRAGQCLHAILERVDFTGATGAEEEGIIATALREHGFGDEWIQPVAAMIERVVTTPLCCDTHLRLTDLSHSQRVSEMPFFYPIAKLEVTDLRRLFEMHGFCAAGPMLPDTIEQLRSKSPRSFVQGFIDLVFEHDDHYYLVDYKTNWLGPQVGDYHRGALQRVVAREAYSLQYVIYTLALHRYLEQCLAGYDYEAHFGGVYCLFIRGMNPSLGPRFGVFRDRPQTTLISALDSYFRTGDIRSEP